MAHEFTKIFDLGLKHYNVGFLKIGDDIVSLMGSGTFVHFGSIFGILTADHVLDVLLDRERVGLVCLPVRSDLPQRLLIDMSAIDYVRLGSQPHTINGPDLAFIKLPMDLVATLQASVSFLNGESQYADFRAGTRFTNQRAYFVTGGVAEWIADPVDEGGRRMVLFKALASNGIIAEEKVVNGLDIKRFEPIAAPDFVFPQSYGGMSGGGLWSLPVEKDDDGIWRVAHRCLAGVAYWQEPYGSEMHIYCHGSESIYGKLRDMILAKWPDADGMV